MTDVEFVIPTNKDVLLQGEPGQYSVTNVCSLPELSHKLADCRNAINEVGTDFILDHFDTLFSVLVHFKHADLSTLSKGWNVIMKGYSMLHSSLTLLLEEGDFDSELRFKTMNVTKMTTYILIQMMRAFEEKLTYDSRSGILIETGKGRKKNYKKPEYEDFNWEAKSHGALVLLHNVIQLPLNKLWEPPIAEEEFVNLIADCCYKILENPGISAAKVKYMRETIFQVLGTLIKRYNHGLSCSVKIIHLLKLYEHLVSPLAQGVVQLVEEFGCRTIVREIVREISSTDSSDLMQDTSGTRAYSQFLVEVAERVPELIVPAINELTVHLEGESPAMRMCVLGIMGEIVLRMLSVENLEESSRDMRDQFLDHLEDHLHDVNAFVRVKVLQIWQRLCQEKCIPLSRQGQVLKLVVGRLQDKSCNVKKNAMHLVTTFLEGNPFAAKLGLGELKSQLQREMQTLQKLQGKSGTDAERRRHVTEVGRHQAWLEHEPEVAHVIEHILQAGSTEDEPPTQVLTQNSLAQSLEEIQMKLGQKQYLEAYHLLRNAEKQFPGAQELRCDMDMESQVGYFLNLLRKIFVECNSSDGSSQQSSQSEAVSGTASQESEIVSQSAVESAVESQQAVVQYLQDTITFVELVSSAFPVICQLLHSRQVTDVVEAIDFFTSAYQFGMADAIIGVQQMLVLVWSRDQAVKDAVAVAYKKLYLFTESTTPRAHAVQVVKNLSGLLKIVNLGQLAALEELIKDWVKNGSIDKACIQVMWERFSLNIPDTSEDDSLAALVLLGMVAGAEAQTVLSNIPVLVSIGFGERGMRNYRLTKETCQVLLKLVAQKLPANSPVPPLRFSRDHDIFTSIVNILTSGFWNLDDNYYKPMSSEAIDVIYQLAEQPDVICEELIKCLLDQIKHGKPPEIPVNNQVLNGLLDNHHEVISSQPDTQVSVECPFEVVTRFMVMVGHIALRQMLYLDVAVFCELKRRNVLREERDERLHTKKQKKKKQQSSSRNSFQNAAHISMSASETPRNKQELSDGDDEAGVVGAVADDQEAEYIRNVCENEIVTGKGLLAALSPLVVTICSNPIKYADTKLQTAASLTLAKMMMVSSHFCEDHIQLLVTVLEKSTEPVTRSNLIVALGDLSYRFPNIIVPWTSHIYGRLRDSSSEVRQVTLLVLTNLIMNDMVKVKGQISEMALCIVDTEQKIAEMASMFFTELSQKGNTLYNVMPDIISRLSTPDLNLDEEKFKTIMKFVMGLIQKDRQMESLVEKLCLRFRLSENERQWSDLAYCLSLLQYSERSLRKLSENLPCYADKLHSPKVYETFCSILAAISKTSKPELKAAVAELEAKINECNSKGAEDVLVSQKAAKASGRRRTAVNTPAGNRINSAARRQPSRSTARHNRLRRRYSDSEDSDTSDGENSEQDDIFVRPKTTTRKVTGGNKIADDTESSDEDISASPDHKRQCNDREQRKISTTSTPQTRSTSRSKHSSQTRSARRTRTRNK